MAIGASVARITAEAVSPKEHFTCILRIDSLLDPCGCGQAVVQAMRERLDDKLSEEQRQVIEQLSILKMQVKCSWHTGFSRNSRYRSARIAIFSTTLIAAANRLRLSRYVFRCDAA